MVEFGKKPVAAVILLFVLGAVSGSLSTKIYFDRQNQFGRGDWLARKKVEVRNTLNSELKLAPDQDAEVEKIINDAFGKLQDIREKQQPAIQEVLDQGALAIKEKLNGEQKEKFAALYGEFLRKRKQWRAAASRKTG